MADLFQPGATNYSLHALPAALFISALPHWWSIYQVESRRGKKSADSSFQKGWDNTNPRAWVARLNAQAASGKQLTPLEGAVLRAQSAQQNGFEWFGAWGLAILAGNVAKLPAHELNSLTLAYLALRVIYNYLYVTTSSRGGSFIRTAVFQGTVIIMVRLFWKSGQALK
ncbi:hypothetical protein IE81DRAFT_322013 [Ceraceosorus guamensis]|uniref:Membrane-associated proteins in eicosanoid and glutathione metabolism n=1 Tax=Ceraceosorus guamensis TaxID=1522189 RepID=A0A316W567_9BASI|nr:hypothetical protein IE81DRAFT_322013 [Ceraceosorus guamensis]PWN43841.1 hypothetical protein IE81DRAFT_322013 [Ceraceosorus guamensis]